MGGEEFHKWLELGVDEGRDVYSRGTVGGDDGAAGVDRFVNFREWVYSWSARLGVKE